MTGNYFEVSPRSSAIIMAKASLFANKENDKLMYNLCYALSLKGALDKERLQSALRRLSEEEPMMHAYFSNEGMRFYIHEAENRVHIEEIVPEGETADERLQNAREAMQAQARNVIDIFDPEAEKFIFRLYEIAEDDHYLAFSVHHAFMDYSSVMILLKRLFDYYADENAPFGGSASFEEFTTEDIRFAASDEVNQEDEYWKALLEGYEKKRIRKSTPLEKIEFDENTEEIMQQGFARFFLDRNELERIAQDNRTSMFNVCMLIFHLAVSKTDASPDTVLQYVISNRSEKQYQKTVGNLLGSLVNRMTLSEDDIISDLHKTLRKKMGEAYSNRRSNYKEELCVGGNITYYSVTNEDMGDFAELPEFNGRPVRIEPIIIDVERKFGFIAMLMMPVMKQEMIAMVTDYSIFYKHLMKLKENILLAARFVSDYPEKTVGDFMREDITLDTLDLLDDAEMIEL